MSKMDAGQNQRGAERRSWDRFAVEGGTIVHADVDGQKYECALIDISMGGARLQTADPIPLNSKVSILRNEIGELSGECVWQSSAMVGIRFQDARLPARAPYSHSCP